MSERVEHTELRKLAEAATPGPWAFEIVPEDDAERKKPQSEWTGIYLGREDDEYPGRVAGTFIEGNLVDEPAEANAAFIAAANPKTVLALLAERDRLREAISKMLKAWDLLPAQFHYTPKEIQLWLAAPEFAEAIPLMRAALKDTNQ